MAVQNATIVAVIGESAADVIDSLSPLRGVEALHLGEPDAEGTRRISASRTPYVVHDADPLGHVAHAWVEFFRDQATGGALELEVDVALAAFRRGERVMPDYYVVLDPESLDPIWRHWWFGTMAGQAPRRVLPQEASAGAIRRMLRKLPTAPGWAAPASWLPAVQFTIPDARGSLGV